jgi:hypothetical protein
VIADSGGTPTDQSSRHHFRRSRVTGRPITSAITPAITPALIADGHRPRPAPPVGAGAALDTAAGNRLAAGG